MRPTTAPVRGFVTVRSAGKIPQALNRLTYHLPFAPWSSHQFGAGQAATAARSSGADAVVPQVTHGTGFSPPAATASAS